MPRYSLRTLLIVLALGPMMLAWMWIAWQHHTGANRRLEIEQMRAKFAKVKAIHKKRLMEIERQKLERAPARWRVSLEKNLRVDQREDLRLQPAEQGIYLPVYYPPYQDPNLN